jgi:ribonuclease P protein component
LGEAHEKNVSTEQAAPQAHAWVPRAYGHKRRPSGSRTASREGPQEARSLSFGRLIPGSPDRPRYTLPARKRIRRKADFDVVHARGRRLGNGIFGIVVRPNGRGEARLGLAVSIKVSGSGVERNRIRRVIRESFRLHQHELPAVDVVISVRSRARASKSAELRTSLEELWTMVRRFR